jgi:hypothetical protein
MTQGYMESDIFHKMNRVKEWISERVKEFIDNYSFNKLSMVSRTKN